MSAEGLAAARKAMEQGDVHPRAIDVSTHYYGLLERGSTGTLAEPDIAPVDALPRLADLDVHTVCVGSAAPTLRHQGVSRCQGLLPYLPFEGLEWRCVRTWHPQHRASGQLVPGVESIQDAM